MRSQASTTLLTLLLGLSAALPGCAAGGAPPPEPAAAPAAAEAPAAAPTAAAAAAEEQLAGVWTGTFAPMTALFPMHLEIRRDERGWAGKARFELGKEAVEQEVRLERNGQGVGFSAPIMGAEVHFQGQWTGERLIGTFAAVKKGAVKGAGTWDLDRKGATQPQAAPTREEVAGAIEGLRAEWTAALQDLQVPGMAVAVVRGDEVLALEALGHRDVERRQPVTTDTQFYIASSTKSFVAMAVLMLVEEGKLSLDTPVKKVLPRFELADPAASRAITVADLLAHRRGITSEEIIQGEAFTGDMTEDRFYRLLRGVSPAGKFLYDNVNYTLLGRIIQAVSGKSWKAYVAERILAPAGMTRTTASADAMYASADAAAPAELSGGALKACAQRKTDRTMHAAGGLGASIGDLSRWLRIHLGGGAIEGKQVASRAIVEKMQERSVETRETFYDFTREGYGLGWYLGSYRGQRMVHHFGSYCGARAHVSFLPERGVGVAVVMNQSGDAMYLADAVAADVYDVLLGVRRPEGPSARLAALRDIVRLKQGQAVPLPAGAPAEVAPAPAPAAAQAP